MMSLQYKKLNKVITTKDEHCCGAFRRINLEGVREGVVIENLFHCLFSFFVLFFETGSHSVALSGCPGTM